MRGTSLSAPEPASEVGRHPSSPWASRLPRERRWQPLPTVGLVLPSHVHTELWGPGAPFPLPLQNVLNRTSRLRMSTWPRPIQRPSFSGPLLGHSAGMGSFLPTDVAQWTERNLEPVRGRAAHGENLFERDVNTEENKARSQRNHQIEVNPWIQPCLRSLDLYHKNPWIPFRS